MKKTKKIISLLCSAAFLLPLAASLTGCSGSVNREIPDDEQMQAIYRQLATPNKIGAVVKFEDEWCDSPTVFYKDGVWYMLFIKYSPTAEKPGYDTHIAKSTDLIHWEYMYPILERTSDGGWDSAQVAAYAAFQDITFGGSNELQKIGGYYYMSYLGGGSAGYETHPLMTGLCKAKDITDPETFIRFEDPILRPDDPDSDIGEQLSIYKHCMFKDSAKTTGHRYVSAYNAKDPISYRERIYLAVSDDGEHWQRYGNGPIIDDDTCKITGDPQIIKIDDIYVMVYFVLKDEITYNTFACSRDLVNWKLWDGEPLIKSEYEWEDKHAHKSWVIKHDGVVYHFYCAVNSKNERFIALATS